MTGHVLLLFGFAVRSIFVSWFEVSPNLEFRESVSKFLFICSWVFVCLPI